jgi:hypothetical protein
VRNANEKAAQTRRFGLLFILFHEFLFIFLNRAWRGRAAVSNSALVNLG